MEAKYSLTTLLSDLLKLQNNSYNILTKLSDVVSSNTDTVEVEIMDENNNIKKVAIPSFGALQSKIQQLENNQKSLSAVGDSNSNIQLPDGTFRKLILNKLQKEAEDIASIDAPTRFETRSNWFFESFLNPLMYIDIDLSGQIKSNTERIQTSRFILNLDTTPKLNYFNDNLKGRSDVSYNDFLQILLDEDITYFADDDIIDIPPRTLRYYGNFSVIRVLDQLDTELIDQAEFSKRVIKVQLDTLKYSDRDSKFDGTQELKIGHSLLLNVGDKNTRFQITNIDSGTRTVSLKRVEGYDNIQIGSKIFSFYDINEDSVSANINIGFNEYMVIFMKPIDPDSKIPSINWSPGIAFYSNDLGIRDENGEETTLDKYYQNEVIDFGSYLYSMAKEKVPPSILGVVPDAPKLEAGNFEVVQINEHVTDNSVTNEIKKLQTDKIRVLSEIKEIEKSIDGKRTKVQTKKYQSQRVEDGEKNELKRLIEERNSKSTLFSSIVNDIISKSKSEEVEKIRPKYRLRGFWPIPEPKVSDRTAAQEVVQFAIQYRYLSKEGSSNQPKQLEFTDIDGSVRRGAFSNWTLIKTDVRRRVEDPDTGEISWIVEDVEDADTPNINQLDLAIRGGESIEFRIKSFSEAGWPINPKESDWSEIIKVDFPDALEGNFEIDQIIEQTKKEEVRVQLEQELNQIGIRRHLEGSFSANEKYFAHDAKEIASGSVTDQQVVISLFEKLNSLDFEINSLRSLIESSVGKMVVKIVDEAGQEITIANNTKVPIFAGDYKDEVKNLTIKKGVIVTKTYYIKIENTAASDLEMYSRLPGSRYVRCKDSWNNTGATSTFNSNDPDYNLSRKFDFVPIGLANPIDNDVNTYDFINRLPNQTSQVNSQWIYSRYKNIEGSKDLYGSVDTNTGSVFGPTSLISSLDDGEYFFDSSSILGTTGGTSSIDFIWGGTSSSGVISSLNASTLYPNMINVHIDHPKVSEFVNTFATNGYSSAAEMAESEIRNSKFAILQKNDVNGNKQAPYYFGSNSLGNDKTIKCAFSDDDQYLIGPYSVGSYMFLAPLNHSSVIVDGSDAISFKYVKFGSSESITIPIIFQYRMTDYFGSGSSGIGKIGGDQNDSLNQLEYIKTLGIDIYSNKSEIFSFDLEVTARYQSKSLKIEDVPNRSFENAIDDLTKTVKSLTPTITK